MLSAIYFLAISCLLAGCAAPGYGSADPHIDPVVSPDIDDALPKAGLDLYADCNASQGATVPAGLSSHFRQWLDQNGYGDFDFARTDISGGSFGGFADADDCVRRQPVIFVHGNGDRALGGSLGGWEDSLAYFNRQGYRRAELYATTYGPANPALSSGYYHSRDYLTHVRAFIEAVLEYTGADSVDIIAHSMGVTVARKAIRGGSASDRLAGGSYSLGGPLTAMVDTFVAIAGGNRGLASCYYTPGLPTCGTTNGFYPGSLLFGVVVGQSDFLRDLNSASRYEGAFRYSIWSRADQVVSGACLVWGHNTCRLPGHTGEKSYSSAPYGHFGLRDLTAAVQFRMVVDHRI